VAFSMDVLPDTTCFFEEVAETIPVKGKRYKPSDAGRLARKTAEVMRDRPWIRNAFGTVEGMCALGAMNLAVCGRIQSRKVHPLVRYTNNLFEQWHGRAIPIFNDHVAQTKEDVIEMLLKFADEYDVKGARHGG